MTDTPYTPVPDEAPASSSFSGKDLFRNLVAGLTVSFVAISLGAAFGELSGRGATAGILSAGVIAFLTALFGGTRIQCSGPTAPMTAVVVVVVAFAQDPAGLAKAIPGANPDHFINVTLILTGAMLALLAVFRLGRFISYVPKVVISGFMNGIAVLIWVGEVKKLFGLGGKSVLAGGVALNLGIALVTLALCFTLPKLLRRVGPMGHYLPATLIAIALMTLVVHLGFGEAARVKMGASDQSLLEHLRSQFPTDWSFPIVSLAGYYALNLVLLAYLDTLLTALVVDKLMEQDLGVEEQTKQNKELAAQGLANAAAGLIGGIPGAQATIRSVLILKEGATMRLAGVAVGAFVLIEMLAFQDLIALIPSAVFSGVLIKVGYDVMDWGPLVASGRKALGKVPPATALMKDVAWIDMLFVVGTTAVTIAVNLNAAVISFLVLFYALRLRGIRVPDFATPQPAEPQVAGASASAAPQEQPTANKS
ncbi:MAG: SulP family inorganic anion transporter [Planctomycetota bacterium]